MPSLSEVDFDDLTPAEKKGILLRDKYFDSNKRYLKAKVLYAVLSLYAGCNQC